MRRRRERSSDIELARETSRRLASVSHPSPGVEGTPDTTQYRRFPVAQPAPEFSPATPSERQEPVPQTVADPSFELDSWESFLTWGLDVSRARAAFVVNSQGFVIARKGNVPKDGFEEMGAELCLAMGQLEHVDPDAGLLRTFELEFQNRRIVSLCALDEQEESLIIGFVVSEPVADEVRREISRHLRYNLAHF